MYDEKAKKRTMRYIKEKRDTLNLNLPKGSKERYRQHAESKGQSLTSLIIELLEEDIGKSEKPDPTDDDKPPGGLTPMPNVLHK